MEELPYRLSREKEPASTRLSQGVYGTADKCVRAIERFRSAGARRHSERNSVAHYQGCSANPYANAMHPKRQTQPLRI